MHGKHGFTLVPAADRAWLLSADPDAADAVVALEAAADRLRRGAIPGVVDVVPGYETILIALDPAADPAPIESEIRRLLRRLPRPAGDAEGPIVEIPVCYEGRDFAPDLEQVASYCGLTETEVVGLHCAREYLVRFLGFMPGFPYLDGLDPDLAVPRLDTPRKRVPAGSVAIGGSQTGVYPFATPGGWRIIGRTPVSLYDPDRQPRALLEMGDRVRFVPIPPSRFESWAGGGR